MGYILLSILFDALFDALFNTLLDALSDISFDALFFNAIQNFTHEKLYMMYNFRKKYPFATICYNIVRETTAEGK